LFVSPIAFTTADIPERWLPLYMANPLVGVIDGFRWSILSDQFPVDARAIASSIVVAVAALTFGLWYFRRTERGFADAI
jgi:lipopolysaccharide transport system permease protein